MITTSQFLLGVLVAGFVGLLSVIMIYNGLVNKRNTVKNAFSTIDALLKKRFDLLPNLIAAVKTYMKHEATTLKEVTEMRARAESGGLTDKDKVDLDAKLTRAIGGIMVAVENYPDLKANQNFLQLQASMNEVEEQISAGRRAYNAAVQDYNNACQMFPSSIIASLFTFEEKQFFEVPQQERQNVNAAALFNQ